MKNKLFFTALLVAVLAIGFVFVACDNDGGTTAVNDETLAALLAGTWKGDNNGATVVYSGNNQFKRTTSGGSVTQGTYTITAATDIAGTMTFKASSGSWNGAYAYEITGQSPYTVKLTHTSGGNEINTGDNGRVITWTKQ